MLEKIDFIQDAAGATKTAAHGPEDYIDRGTGLLFCGKCHTAKQTKVNGVLRPILCSCRQAEVETEAAEKHRQEIEVNRKEFFPLASMRKHQFPAAEDAKHIRIARRYVEKWEYCRKENIGLLFWGPVGSGKSFAAHCVGNALIDRDIPVRYASAASLIGDLMDRNVNRRDYIRRLCEVPCLIIDDIGAERDSAYTREQLCGIIGDRLESGKPLIATTNYSLDEMENCRDRLLARTFSRLLDACTPIQVVGKDRREQNASRKLDLVKDLLEE